MIRTTLNNHLRNVRKDEGGFTLIELLIVIVVLGILAGIVVFGVGTFRQDATTAACRADAKSVEVAAEAYNAKTGGYPANIAALVTANYLKAAPTSTGLTYNAATGAVTGCPATTP
jgi:prepilin-type N-terminal cleavage/methylation domain-containing protein